MRTPKLLPWVLVAPILGLTFLFLILPAIDSFYLSLREVDSFSQNSEFTGFANYAALFTSEEYWQSLRVTLLFTLVTVIPGILISLVIAILLDMNPYVQGIFRTIFLLPVAVSSAMAAMLWIFIYNPTAGYLNYMIDRLGGAGPNWLGDPRYALIAVSIATIWKEIGFNIIFFLAGLSSVPPDLREAATLDGAGAFDRFRHVVIPFLSPTLFFVTVVSIINSFQSFGQIHILTGGGPSGETNVLVYHLYKDAFVTFRTGYAAAQAVILFLMMMLVTSIQFRFARKKVFYG